MIERFHRPGQLNDAVRAELVRCWTDVSNAGGAVGFPHPPVSIDEVATAFEVVVAGLHPDRCVLFCARSDAGLQGWVVLSRTTFRLVSHRGRIERFQTRPESRGEGIGSRLLVALESFARDVWGLQQLNLSARGGTGLEEYYGARGFHEIGRWPEALRISEGDVRDEVLMFKSLQE